MGKVKKQVKSRAQLEQDILELKAQLVHVHHFAMIGLQRAGKAAMMGGGVLLQMHGLGGKEVTPPIVIRDGLSDDTIAALERDIVRSYHIATLLKPKGA